MSVRGEAHRFRLPGGRRGPMLSQGEAPGDRTSAPANVRW